MNLCQNNTIEMLWWLLVSHFIFDWGLQNRWMAENKNKYWEILLAHCMIYTDGITLTIKLFTGNLYLLVIPFILIGHYITDYISSSLYSINNTKERNRRLLWVDHLIHLLQLLIVLYLIA